MIKLRYNLMLLILLSLGNLVSAQPKNHIDSLRKMLNFSQKKADQLNIISQLGYEYWTYKPDSSEYFTYNWLSLARELKLPVAEERALILLALINYSWGNSTKVFEFGLEAVKLAEKNGRKNDRAEAQAIVGMSYAQIKNYDTALLYVRQSVETFDSLMQHKRADFRDILLSQIVKANFSSLYLEMNQTDSAEKYALLAYEGWMDNDGIHSYNIEATTTILNAIAMVKSRKQDLADAAQYLQTSIAISREYPVQNAYMNYQLASVYMENKQTDSAMKYGSQAMSIAQSIQNNRFIFQAAEMLSRLYAVKGVYQQAYSFSRQALEARDSIDVNQKRINFKNLRTFDAIERKHEIDRATAEYKNSLTLYCVIAGALIFLLAAVFSFLNAWRKKRQILFWKIPLHNSAPLSPNSSKVKKWPP